MPCLHAPKSVWRHSVREFHGQKPNACLSFLQYRACERRYRCCYLPISYLPLRRMPSNDSAWCTLLHITGCIQSISLHGRWPSRCSVPCACPCTQRRPASRRGRSLHAAHSDAVAASLPRASSSTIVPVAIVCRPGPYRAVAVVNHDNWHAHC